MELKKGTELNDENALRDLRVLYGANRNGIIAVFLWILAGFFLLLSLMAASFALKGDKVASNAFGAVLFLAVALLLANFGRKKLEKMKNQVRAVHEGKFRYREAVVVNKHFGSSTVGGVSRQLNLLVFQSDEAPGGTEEVSVFRDLYDEVSVGQQLYVIYLPEGAVTAIRKYV